MKKVKIQKSIFKRSFLDTMIHEPYRDFIMKKEGEVNMEEYT